MSAGHLGHYTEHLLLVANLHPLKKFPFNSSEHRIGKGEEVVPQLVLHALVETDEELLEATVGGGGADCIGEGKTDSMSNTGPLDRVERLPLDPDILL